MLFSAGMGISLVFWSVAEPIFCYVSPPIGQAETVEAAQRAMSVTLLHWGVHRGEFMHWSGWHSHSLHLIMAFC